MYVPPLFKEDRVEVLHEAIEKIGFASLVTLNDEGMEASHVPLLIAPGPGPFGTLRGHLSRGNPQWQRTHTQDDALAMFLGPNTYVTPSWYPTKKQSGKVVPTWNYLAVHAYGKIEFFHDPERLRELVGALTQKYESPRAQPWAVSDAPEDYLAQMLRAIVGFEMVITRLEGKWKMSQNRPAEDIAGVKAALQHEGAPDQVAVAAVMAARPGKTGE